MGERAPDPQVAEVQRREFFGQLHRWLRQGQAVHVFCNNDGEQERFKEVWAESGFGDRPAGEGAARGWDTAQPVLHLGALHRGFLCPEARVVVVTDAEIFGRYKVARPRRLKSAHAAAVRSVLDIVTSRTSSQVITWCICSRASGVTSGCSGCLFVHVGRLAPRQRRRRLVRNA